MKLDAPVKMLIFPMFDNTFTTLKTKYTAHRNLLYNYYCNFILTAKEQRIMNTSADQYVRPCSLLEATSYTIVQFPSKFYVINQIIICFLNGMLTVAAVLLNGIAILTMYRCFHLRDKVCYFLIAVQSVVDFITGVVSIPLFTFILASELAGAANCVVNFIVANVAFLPMGLSLVMLCGLSIERYMGVLHPVNCSSYSNN